MNGDLERLVFGRGAPETHPQQIVGGAICEGTVHTVDADGIRFTIGSYDDHVALFGPAPWQRPLVTDTDPPAGPVTLTVVTPSPGDRVLVIFVGGFPDGKPWVAAWWPA